MQGGTDPGRRRRGAPASAPNLFEMIPDRAHEWVEDEAGRIRVLVPRYGNSALGRWFAAWIGRPHIHVKFDEIGSAIWRRCDGTTPVAEIARDLEARFGEALDPLEPRIGRFFAELDRGRLIRWKPTADH